MKIAKIELRNSECKVFESNVLQLNAFPTQNTLERLKLTQRYKIQAKLEEKRLHMTTIFLFNAHKNTNPESESVYKYPGYSGESPDIFCFMTSTDTSTASFAKNGLDPFPQQTTIFLLFYQLHFLLGLHIMLPFFRAF